MRHTPVGAWETLVAPLLTGQLRARRRGEAGRKWHCDETYITVHGAWCYLYRAIDTDGNLVDYVAASNVVDRHIRNLRAKLQNDHRRPRYIATIHGRGYRFIPSTTDEDAGPAPA